MPEPSRAPLNWKPSLPYLVPFALFMLITTAAEPKAGAWYPAIYAAKVFLVIGALFFFWRKYDELFVRPSASALLLGVGVGFIVFAEWAFVETRELVPPLPFMGTRAAYDPFTAIQTDGWRIAFISIRLFGMAVMVPVMEELLWRSWLLRIIVREDFKSVAVGTFTWPSCFISAGFFALGHPEWFSAFLCGLAYNVLLYRTKNLWVCIAAHATTNLALGIYVLVTGTWKLW